MPSNSSSRLNTMSGFQSMMARRNSDRLSLNPNGLTSWPSAFKCEMTSYSVRHSSISFSVEPFRESGGTSVACTRTRARTFLTGRPSQGTLSQGDSRQLPLFVRLGQPRNHPQQVRLELAPRTAHIQIQRFAALDHEPQHLMHQVFAECAGADDLLAQGIAQFTQHARRLERVAGTRRRGEHLEQQFIVAGAAGQRRACQSLLVVIAQGARLVRHVLDGAAVRY